MSKWCASLAVRQCHEGVEKEEPTLGLSSAAFCKFLPRQQDFIKKWLYFKRELRQVLKEGLLFINHMTWRILHYSRGSLRLLRDELDKEWSQRRGKRREEMANSEKWGLRGLFEVGVEGPPNFWTFTGLAGDYGVVLEHLFLCHYPPFEKPPCPHSHLDWHFHLEASIFARFHRPHLQPVFPTLHQLAQSRALSLSLKAT